MSIREEELRIPVGDEDICGFLCRPDMEGEKYPLIIVSHGFYASHELMKNTALNLTECGFMTYRFDYHGLSYTHLSGGKLEESSIKTEINDLTAVLAYFEKREDVDNKRIYLLGQSMGGVVSALTAAKNKDMVAGLVLMCPAMNMKDTCNAYFEDVDDIPDVIIDFVGIPNLNLGKIFFDDLFGTDFEEIFEYDKAVYLLHGTKDEMVPLSYSEKLEDKYSNIRFIKVPGAVHNFSLDHVQAQKVADFFRNAGGDTL